MRIINKDTITLRRLRNGYYNLDGEYVEGHFTDTVIRCSIQPDFEGNLRMIKEMGLSSEDCLSIFTQTLLRTDNEHTNTQADRLVHDGQVYEVVKVRAWMGVRRLSHYTVIAKRQDKDYLNGSA